MEGGYKRPIDSSLHDVDDREWIWRKKDRGAKKMRTTHAKAEEEPEARRTRRRIGDTRQAKLALASNACQSHDYCLRTVSANYQRFSLVINQHCRCPCVGSDAASASPEDRYHRAGARTTEREQAADGTGSGTRDPARQQSRLGFPARGSTTCRRTTAPEVRAQTSSIGIRPLVRTCSYVAETIREGWRRIRVVRPGTDGTLAQQARRAVSRPAGDPQTSKSGWSRESMQHCAIRRRPESTTDARTT
jgi:hypothetical protein